MPEVTLIATWCSLCQQYDRVMVPADQYQTWKNGELVQKAFPDLPAPQREQIISGTCPQCWEKFFAPPD